MLKWDYFYIAGLFIFIMFWFNLLYSDSILLDPLSFLLLLSVTIYLIIKERDQIARKTRHLKKTFFDTINKK
ncbi:hypothetical protein [Companilactobacillus kedongensis]|uniref:hypothetical protein n=1 Tax=Companilactobacillus kedongensis TaxID=2486004 RepID=UPI000F7A51AE|nr:hypothetical protein [Companilactobacillus kedongensis]